MFSVGVLAVFTQSVAANTLGGKPTTSEGRIMTERTMMVLGIRDLALATALFWFCRDDKEREMGGIYWSLFGGYMGYGTGPWVWNKRAWELTGETAAVMFGGWDFCTVVVTIFLAFGGSIVGCRSSTPKHSDILSFPKSLHQPLVV